MHRHRQNDQTRQGSSGTIVRAAEPRDLGGIVRIYNHYIRETVITFEEEEVAEGEIQRRMERVADAHLPWLVAEDEGTVIGYAYAARWHLRSAYRHSAESTVYLDHRHTGRGVGLRLYQTLIELLRARSLHTVIGGIALPNDASVALHEKMQFFKVAHYKEVGFKFGLWIDVGYWQLLL